MNTDTDTPTRAQSPPQFELDAIGPAVLLRAVVIAAVLAATVPASVVRRGLRGVRPGVAAAEGIVDGFAILGPLLVKLGQLIASAPGTFPRALSDACLRCLDAVPPFPAARARQIIEADLGRPVAELFAEFDDVPLAAASIAQVHGCVLADGRVAVVKVRRPGIAGRMRTDLRAALLVARLLERFLAAARVANAVGAVRDLHRIAMSELDLDAEARHQDLLRRNLAAFGDNEGVVVPEVYWSHCGRRTLCMQRLHGIPFRDLDAVGRAGVDTELLIRQLVKVWLEGLMLHGTFHGDAHAGNLLLLPDGRIAMLDFGIVGTMPAEWRMMLQGLFYANLVDGHFDRVSTAMRGLGLLSGDAPDDRRIGSELDRVLRPLLSGELARLDLRALTSGLLEFGELVDMVAPEPLMLMGKQLAYFERYAVTLAPHWVLGRDLFLFRNIFPREVAAAADAQSTKESS